jgi:hypothetical protein
MAAFALLYFDSNAHYQNEDPICGNQIETKVPILHVKGYIVSCWLQCPKGTPDSGTSQMSQR